MDNFLESVKTKIYVRHKIYCASPFLFDGKKIKKLWQCEFLLVFIFSCFMSLIMLYLLQFWEEIELKAVKKKWDALVFVVL